MMVQTLQHCVEAIPNQVEFAKFRPPTYLNPTNKLVGPFHTWCIDTIPNLPESPEGFKHLVVAVDVFTKWVEAWPMKTMNSIERVWAFHRDVTCRMGTPHAIRMDRGTEFAGEFKSYAE